MQTTSSRITLRFVPLPTAFVQEARLRRIDGFGHGLEAFPADGPSPCRHCLRYVCEGTPLLLMSYRPLDDRNPYAEVGPIFICAEDCSRYEEASEFPPDFLNRSLVVRAYDRAGRIFDAVVAEPGTAQDIAESFLSDECVAEVHVRNPSYGCFDFRVERG